MARLLSILRALAAASEPVLRERLQQALARLERAYARPKPPERVDQ